ILFLGSLGEAMENLTQITVFCSQYGREQWYWYCYVLILLYMFALPVGILGNITALINYTCCKKSWTTSKIFLFNLVLCDFAWISTLPITIYFNLQRPTLTDAQIFCQFKKIFFNINIYGSIFFLTLISFDRYVGTVHPISSLNWWNKEKAKICSISVWTILFLGSIPDFFYTFAVKRQDNVTVCIDHIQGPFTYVKTISILRTIIGFLVPFSVMLAFYIMTAKALRNLPKRMSNGRKSGKPFMLISAAILIFIVSFVPYHVMIMTLIFLRIGKKINKNNVNILYAAYQFFEAVFSISSCLDPILYILASEQFQKRWLALKKHPKTICFCS
uniref:G-protein coupled receptors family 1 profile domain-containing protein n=1 Tax=Lepisosteus oculatus TaxID=7918 RepID=W5NLN6_LEPOC